VTISGQGAPYHHGVGSWFRDQIVDSGHFPLFLCFAAFIVTFVTTRVITRMIRADKGPFKDNVTDSGVHVHHAVPGIILMTIGAFTAVAADTDSAWSVVAALMIGIGSSLVLDEFALILRLQDVYWDAEGRVSVEMVALAAACLGLVLVGLNPLALADDDLPATLVTIALHLALVAGCVAKGKLKTALFGVFIPFLALVGCIRLARPRSRWARRRYSDAKLARATERARRHDARYGPAARWLSDFVAGKPTATSEPAPRGSA
jgi:hypothetical protein